MGRAVRQDAALCANKLRIRRRRRTDLAAARLVQLVAEQAAHDDIAQGIRSTPSTAAVNIPPTTHVPMSCRPLAPAPVDTTIGKTPRMKANEVMMMGRKRSRAASSTALWRLRPLRCSVTANSTMRIAFFAVSPMMAMRPDLEIDVVRQTRGRSVASVLPMRPTGTANSTDSGNAPALVERRQREVDDDDRQGEQRRRLRGREDLLQRLSRPVVADAGRQVPCDQPLHLVHGLAGAVSLSGRAHDLHRRVAVVARQRGRRDDPLAS